MCYVALSNKKKFKAKILSMIYPNLLKIILLRDFLKTILLPVFMVGFLAMPTASLAWFAGAATHERPRPGGVVETVDRLNTFVLYDNGFSSPTRETQITALPASPFFVPADRIDVHIPLNFFARHAGSAVESLDRLLLANIRLRQLLAERDQLQKRADKLLTSLAIPFLDAPLFKDRHQGAESIAHQKKKYEQQLSSVAAMIQPNAGSSSLVAGFQAVRHSSEKYANSTDPGDRVNNSYQTPFTNTNGPRTYTAPAVGDASSELPWLFTFFLETISYVISHKFEILFSGAMFCVLIYFLFILVK